MAKITKEKFAREHQRMLDMLHEQDVFITNGLTKNVKLKQKEDTAMKLLSLISMIGLILLVMMV